MNNSFIYFTGLLVAITAITLITVASQEYNNTSLNNIVLNNIPLSSASINSSTMNKMTTNATNETAFRIGNNLIEGNRSAFNVSLPIKSVKDAGKLGYIIQATPHGTV